MNIVLVQAGYPPIIISPENRPQYLQALATFDKTGNADAFHTLMYQQLEHSLDAYLHAARTSTH